MGTLIIDFETALANGIEHEVRQAFIQERTDEGGLIEALEQWEAGNVYLEIQSLKEE
jgi:hypothetical protein